MAPLLAEDPRYAPVPRHSYGASSAPRCVRPQSRATTACRWPCQRSGLGCASCGPRRPARSTFACNTSGPCCFAVLCSVILQAFLRELATLANRASRQLSTIKTTYRRPAGRPPKHKKRRRDEAEPKCVSSCVTGTARARCHAVLPSLLALLSFSNSRAVFRRFAGGSRSPPWNTWTSRRPLSACTSRVPMPRTVLPADFTPHRRGRWPPPQTCCFAKTTATRSALSSQTSNRMMLPASLVRCGRLPRRTRAWYDRGC